MKERQRWQPEEDSLLQSYVNQYGPKEWHLISQRFPNTLLNRRDPKSCFERWKNYLKPGIKKGSLSVEEQRLVVSLQAEYGNKWKKIAAEVPGRTAKRLGKWWEVFKEKQLKELKKKRRNCCETTQAVTGLVSTYDHILDTFADKYVQPWHFALPLEIMSPPPVLSLGSVPVSEPVTPPVSSFPPWMTASTNMNLNANATHLGSNTSSLTSTSSTPSPSVSLTLSPSEPVVLDPVHSDIGMPTRFIPVQQVGILAQCCRELEEARQNWVHHKKEATWRLNRVEQQLESEKARKRREKMEEIEAKIRCLREEEMAFVSRMECEYREQLLALQRDAESKEAKLVEAWSNKQIKLSRLVEQIGVQSQLVQRN